MRVSCWGLLLLRLGHGQHQLVRPSALADSDTQHACGAVLAGLCQSRTELRGLSWDLSLLTL